MENTSTPTPSPSPVSAPTTPTADDLYVQVAALNKLCTWLLFSTLLIGGAFGYFLLRQVRGVNRQVNEAKKFMADYQTNRLPKMQWFIGSLQQFASTNTDFNPSLAKFGLLPTNAAPGRIAPPTVPPASSKK